ncbi:MAG: hypothetical protein IPK13_05295 [Deltaproteobacteria bacterium]|nr:hypothetical protein [Deltaproteobacteria bacterium]
MARMRLGLALILSTSVLSCGESRWATLLRVPEQRIPSSGGRITVTSAAVALATEDGSFRLVLPQGAVSEPVEITLARTSKGLEGDMLGPRASLALRSDLWRLEPPTLTLTRAARVQIAIGQGESQPDNPVLGVIEGEQMEALSSLGFDRGRQMAMGSTGRLGLFGVFALPDCIGPEQTEPLDTNPSDTNPSDTKPLDTDPSDTNPSDTNPSDTEPLDTDPSDTNPSDTKPLDTDPSDTNPSDTKPLDTDPSDTNPSDTEPLDTDPSDTNPSGNGASYGIGSGWFEGLCRAFTF